MKNRLAVPLRPKSANRARSDRIGAQRPLFLAVAMALLATSVLCRGQESQAKHGDKPERFIAYTNMVDPTVPWSIHVVRIERARSELRFCTTLGGGKVLGMDTVTEQLKSLSPELGQPVAAINGDFYEKNRNYPGRPRDLQIRQGEVVSHPTGHTCFWIDANGQPQMTNVVSRFRVLWPNGKTTPLSLNSQRTNDSAVLYTAVLGPSTLTSGGVEYVLERVPDREWLPLRVGKTYETRVRAVRVAGDTPLDGETLVLSIGPSLEPHVPALPVGATVGICTETIPSLAGIEVAIGGGPSLVRDGKIEQWNGWIHMRHPRTALGWNKEAIFLVEVDGRQIDVSVGMTFAELAGCMLRLGCEQAMNFDGGGSATLWAFGSVRNSPSEGQERPAPNALVVVRKNARRASKSEP